MWLGSINNERLTKLFPREKFIVTLKKNALFWYFSWYFFVPILNFSCILQHHFQIKYGNRGKKHRNFLKVYVKMTLQSVVKPNKFSYMESIEGRKEKKKQKLIWHVQTKRNQQRNKSTKWKSVTSLPKKEHKVNNSTEQKKKESRTISMWRKIGFNRKKKKFWKIFFVTHFEYFRAHFSAKMPSSVLPFSRKVRWEKHFDKCSVPFQFRFVGSFSIKLFFARKKLNLSNKCM